MSVSVWRRAVAVLFAIPLIQLGLATSAAPALAAAAPTTGFRFVDITAADGVVLKANVVEPTTAGRHPTIVFVNSWGLNDLEYLARPVAWPPPATPFRIVHHPGLLDLRREDRHRQGGCRHRRLALGDRLDYRPHHGRPGRIRWPASPTAPASA